MLLSNVEGMAHWRVREVQEAQEWLLPVCVDAVNTKDWLFVRVRASEDGEALGRANSLVVEVVDRVGRRRKADRIAAAVVSLLRGAVVDNLSSAGVRVELSQGPPCERQDSIVVVLGFVFWYLSGRAGVEQRLRVDTTRFVADVRLAADAGFGYLREHAGWYQGCACGSV